jgi:hypothetical protein
MRGRVGTVVVFGSLLAVLVLSTAFVLVALASGTNIGDASSAVGGIAFSALGAVIASKRRENKVGWIFLGIGLSLALNAFAFTYADRLHEIAFEGTAWHWWAWTGTWSYQPGFFLLLPVLFLTFPDGKIVWPAGRRFVAVCSFGLFASLVGTVFNGGNLPELSGFHNPLGDIFPAALMDMVQGLSILTWFLPAVFASARGLYLRFRGSHGVEREQMKWFVLAGFATLVTYIGGSTLYNTFDSTAGGLLALLGVALLPAATAIAILRYRLYEIDRIVNRALVYFLLTAVLALVYLAIVVLLQEALQPIVAASDLAVAGSTLAVAALFQPLRQRLQTFIDKRFYRRRYDAAATIGRFASRLRDEVDLETLSQELIEVVGTTMQPAHASLWLRNEMRV